ncbi:MAG: acyl-CoA N-acyltransferase [Deltaproteobacteria bacterium]|nr:acyl-CoA N-acyltransferase [Deltaproteobacteria bacterium]
MSHIEVGSVSSRSDLKAFVDLPWKIYAGDENWVPPIKKLLRKLLDPHKHPFWQFSRRELFLARRGGKVVGRIAGIVDDNYNRYHNEKSGAWGFFECYNDSEAAQALFNAVENWVTAEGMTYLRGPFSPSTNYEIGMLIEGFEFPPTFMMTYNPKYYPSLVESCDFRKEKDLLALLLDKRPGSGKREFIARLAQKITEKGFVHLRNLDLNSLHSEVAMMKSLYEEAWGKNWGFVPMTDTELMEMAGNLRKLLDPDFAFFVYYKDEPAGFCLIVPDVNPLLRRLNGKLGIMSLLKIALYRKEITGLRGLLFGFKPKYQKLGLPLVAFDHLDRVQENTPQYKYLELGWNLEDNHDINQFEMDLGARIYKKYRIYGKQLSMRE